MSVPSGAPSSFGFFEIRLFSPVVAAALASAFAFGSLTFPFSALAQEDSTGPLPTRAAEPTSYRDIGWHEVIFLNFDSEKTRRAKALTERCLRRATSSPDPPGPQVLELPGGPWDLMLIYSLGDSAREAPALEKKWKSPADLGRLREACRKAAEEGADRTWEEYKGLLASSTMLVGFSGRIEQPPEWPSSDADGSPPEPPPAESRRLPLDFHGSSPDFRGPPLEFCGQRLNSVDHH